MYIPLIGRLSLSEWPVILISFALTWIEYFVAVITTLLPIGVINAFSKALLIFYSFTTNPIRLLNVVRDDEIKYSYLDRRSGTSISSQEYDRMIGLLNSTDIREMCQLFGYDVEQRLVKTDDGYLLTIQRITKPGKQARRSGKVIYLHHGLLMSCEIWVTMLEKNLNLPFILYDLGFDVWLGNNRGNKYSQKHLYYKLNSEEFWNFSLDEFALFDIPNSIDYILKETGESSLTYIGFSQGTAQAFASCSINPELDKKIEQIIAISPATTPHGLYSKFLDILLKSSPGIVYLLFSRRILMPSVIFWQKIMYPPFFDTMIDISNYILFNWKSQNITKIQKLCSYAHLYSTTSVKTVVHWFQIISHKNFQMYHDNSLLTGLNPISYPLKNIKIPIHLIYGTSDSLVDINVMKSQLPEEHTTAHAVENHEHLDNLWGYDVYDKVFRHVLEYLYESYSLDPTSPNASIADSSKTIYKSHLKAANDHEDIFFNGETAVDNSGDVIRRNPSTGGSVFI
ncbi:uncharacterized protein PRCAT00005969001 [Priceomyces carsonii]|uniref:uncharacterized protein n=1 Tax=Priceomyces carsonii TaxID=28549 RepID=UPI002ED7A189|nr:unnamed protein product [Priceomyces carsonii]